MEKKLGDPYGSATVQQIRDECQQYNQHCHFRTVATVATVAKGAVMAAAAAFAVHGRKMRTPRHSCLSEIVPMPVARFLPLALLQPRAVFPVPLVACALPLLIVENEMSCCRDGYYLCCCCGCCCREKNARMRTPMVGPPTTDAGFPSRRAPDHCATMADPDLPPPPHQPHNYYC